MAEEDKKPEWRKGLPEDLAQITSEQYDKLPVKTMHQRKEVLKTLIRSEPDPLPDCYGRFPTRRVTQKDSLRVLKNNVTELKRCRSCDPNVREMCFRSSLIYHLDYLFK